MRKFVNRNNELTFLNKQYRQEGSSFVIVYGRRRIGKTTLIKEFIKDKSALYVLASEELESENKRHFQQHVAQFTNNSLLAKGSNFSWDDIFTTFKDHSPKKKKILVIDEFQYLGQVNPAFPSILQRIWDNVLKDENIMLILCGSLISMMENQTLSHSSPLYGRRTGQIKMKQIAFSEYGDFFPEKNQEELIKYYAVTGGVPKYIELFKANDDIFEAIKENVLLKESFLFEEPIFLLEREVQSISSYLSILKTIGLGEHKLGKIAAYLGVNQTQLTQYLKTLIDMDILEREVPITEKHPNKSKKGLYYLQDNFLQFWFKFVYPYKDYLEMDQLDYVMDKLKANFVDNHLSFVYEKVCRERLKQIANENIFGAPLLQVGRWWDKDEEIDVVGCNEIDNLIVFAECKYWNQPVDSDVFYRLVEKSSKVDWHNGNRNEKYALFSKSGFTKNLEDLAGTRRNLFLFQG
mgnify:CR=1 FL=1